MQHFSKTTLSGYVYEIIGFEDGLSKFKINLVSTRGSALIVAPTDMIYTGAYVDSVGSWKVFGSKRYFLATKIQIVLPKNIDRIDTGNVNSDMDSQTTKIDSKEMLEQVIMEDILLFSRKHNIPARNASLIYKTYKENTIKNLHEDPYKLAFDLKIISFSHAEKIAMDLGIYKHLSKERIEAGIKYVLFEESMKGDISANLMVKKIANLLNIREEVAAKSLEKAIREKVVTIS